jgi:dihydrofolate synthase/folylpolyglutamate synthase
MSYTQAIHELNALAPELFTRPGVPRRKFSLEEVRILLAALHDPQRQFPSVLIAGTNGKGSTAATLASILAHSGLRTGLYTSPHLERPNERIRVSAPKITKQGPANPDLSSQEITDADFGLHYFAVKAAASRLVQSGSLGQPPSFFEILTAMAFLHFAAAHVDVAVLEVGMGGRLDATNVVDPLISVITDISLDHTEWLGDSISAIAREKAGILRPNGILVTLPQHPEANQAIGEVATDLEVRGVPATPYMPIIGAAAGHPYAVEALGDTIEVASPLAGAHQQRNVALAIAAAVELAQQGFPISAASIEAGIRSTQWPGRLERIQIGATKWILDVAHNPAGAWALRAGLRDILTADPATDPAADPATDPASDRAPTLIFSCLRDKPLPEMAQILFPLFSRVIFAPIASPRAASIADLAAAAEATGTPHFEAKSVAEALQLAERGSPVPSPSLTQTERVAPAPSPSATKAIEVAPVSRPAVAGISGSPQEEPSLIVISGSVYLVGEARGLLKSNQLASTSAQPASPSTQRAGTAP